MINLVHFVVLLRRVRKLPYDSRFRISVLLISSKFCIEIGYFLGSYFLTTLLIFGLIGTMGTSAEHLICLEIMSYDRLISACSSEYLLQGLGASET